MTDYIQHNKKVYYKDEYKKYINYLLLLISSLVSSSIALRSAKSSFMILINNAIPSCWESNCYNEKKKSYSE